MNSFFERIADEWRMRAVELAHWTMSHLVNRTDVWGRYLAKKLDTSPTESINHAVTAPFRDERGKVFLNISSLEKHFKAKDSHGILGVHSAASDGSTRWLALDIDLHDEDNLSVTPEGNFVAAHAWWEVMTAAGLDPLLMDSNGRGGFHILVVFDQPMLVKTVRRYAVQLIGDYERRGLDRRPEIFPGDFGPNHYGNWLRLPGRHHTHPHYSSVFNDEPWAEEKWLRGHDAIDRMLRVRPASAELLQPLGIEPIRRTVCLDFDGVVHSYVSGWRGVTKIDDPPIHRVNDSIQRLRKTYRVVIHSARCGSPAGIRAVKKWLNQHRIEVDEVCAVKPPAHVYVDDRAIRFTGDWDATVEEIHQFRK